MKNFLRLVLCLVVSCCFVQETHEVSFPKPTFGNFVVMNETFAAYRVRRHVHPVTGIKLAPMPAGTRASEGKEPDQEPQR